MFIVISHVYGVVAFALVPHSTDSRGPQAVFLGVRAFVMFLHQYRFFRGDAIRYHHIHKALLESGEAIRELKRIENEEKERLEEEKRRIDEMTVLTNELSGGKRESGRTMQKRRSLQFDQKG